MPRDPNLAPDEQAVATSIHEQPGSFFNSAIVALVGLPLYFTDEWKVYACWRWPLFWLTVAAVVSSGVNPFKNFVNSLYRRAYGLFFQVFGRKSRPGKPAILDDEMNFARAPVDSGWSDAGFMAKYEGDVLTMGYLEKDDAGEPVPYTAFRFRKQKDGRIESLIAVSGWDYPQFHRISLPPAIAALLYGTQHAGSAK